MILEALRPWLEKLPRAHYCIAYSGGLDSQVLLHSCAELKKSFPIQLRALHINHGLNPDADAWQAHCIKMCAALSIPLETFQLNLGQLNNQSIEEAARIARYRVFAAYLTENEILLTAHHQDDQAETLLLQLLRGAGLKGLAAMPVEKKLGRGKHVRPFLTIARQQLQAYALEKNLSFVNDDSNNQIRFARNYLRHEIIPKLQVHWPAANQVMARAAGHCQENMDLLDEYAGSLMQQVLGTQPNTLSNQKLFALSTQQQKLVLRWWIHQSGFRVPSQKKLADIQASILTARKDKMPCVHWEEVELRRYQDNLYLLKKLSLHHPDQEYFWDLSQSLPLPGVGELSAEPSFAQGLKADIRFLTVKFRKGGEVAHLKGRGHKTLKNLFQEWQVPPWDRERIPLVYVENQLAGVVGYFICKEFTADKAGEGRQLVLKKTL